LESILMFIKMKQFVTYIVGVSLFTVLLNKQ